ncbi:hypothetical protein HDU97_007108, partial [Phlyctochytrium planicorne]
GQGGWLSGKFKRPEGNAAPTIPEGSRIAWAEKVGWTETNFSKFSEQAVTWNTIDAIHSVAAAHKVPVSAVSLRWLMQKPTVTAPIIGARTIQQLEENLQAANFELSKEEMAVLDKASDLPVPYPNSVINDLNNRYGRLRL